MADQRRARVLLRAPVHGTTPDPFSDPARSLTVHGVPFAGGSDRRLHGLCRVERLPCHTRAIVRGSDWQLALDTMRIAKIRAHGGWSATRSALRAVHWRSVPCPKTFSFPGSMTAVRFAKNGWRHTKPFTECTLKTAAVAITERMRDRPDRDIRFAQELDGPTLADTA